MGDRALNDSYGDVPVFNVMARAATLPRMVMIMDGVDAFDVGDGNSDEYAYSYAYYDDHHEDGEDCGGVVKQQLNTPLSLKPLLSVP